MIAEEGRIELKGTGDGLIIKVHIQGELEPVKKLIQDKIEENPKFYKKATLAELTCNYLMHEDYEELQRWLYDEYQMSSSKKTKRKTQSAKQEPVPMEKIEPVQWDEVKEELVEEDTRFIHGTVRSGQKIHSVGNIVVLGDVNPGAELVAGGNIVVMGSFRGIAHAGAQGKEDSFVAALVLQPTQLRIHQTITRAPDGKIEKAKTPEIARLRESAICIEPFFIKN